MSRNRQIPLNRSLFWAIISLWFIAICLAFYGLGGVALRDFDEGTVARVSYELSQRSGVEQLLPTLWGKPYINKPPGLHWLIASLIKISDLQSANGLPSDFIIRAGPAFLSTLIVPLGGLIQWKLRPGENLTAITTSSILLTLLPIVRHGRLAMLDGTQLTAIALFWFVLLSIDQSKNNKIMLITAGLISSSMLLLKAPLLIPPLIAALIAMFWEGIRLKRVELKWFGIGLIPGCLWHLWHGLNRGSEALWVWFGDGAQRVLFESGEGSDLGFLVPTIELLEGGWPWLLLLPMGIYVAWKERQSIWGKWVISTSLIMSISIFGLKTQLPWYSHPLWLPFALITAPILSKIIKRERTISKKYSLIKLIPYGWIVLGASIVAIGLFTLSEPNSNLKPYIGIIFSIGWCWLMGGYLLIERKEMIRCLGLLTLVIGNLIGLFILMGSQNWVWELNESWPVKPVAEMIRSEEVSDVILDGYNERPSLNWYSNQRVNNKSNPKDIKWVVSDNEIKSNYLIREKKCIEKRRTGKWKLIYCSDY